MESNIKFLKKSIFEKNDEFLAVKNFWKLKFAYDNHIKIWALFYPFKDECINKKLNIECKSAMENCKKLLMELKSFSTIIKVGLFLFSLKNFSNILVFDSFRAMKIMIQ